MKIVITTQTRQLATTQISVSASTILSTMAKWEGMVEEVQVHPDLPWSGENPRRVDGAAKVSITTALMSVWMLQ